jgi:hypothetical protein
MVKWKKGKQLFSFFYASPFSIAFTKSGKSEKSQ